MKKILKIFGIIAGLTVAIVGLVWYLTGDAAKVVNSQLEAMRKGDLEKAYSYTSSQFQEATSQADFAQFVASYKVLKANQKANFNSREISNDITTLTGTLTAEDGTKNEVEYQLIKEDGEWKILSIYIKAGAQSDAPVEDTDTSNDSDTGTKTFAEPDYGYTIDYPAAWEMETSGGTAVVFRSPANADQLNATVNIQNVISDNIPDILNDYKEQLQAIDSDSQFTNEKDFIYASADGTSITGREFTVTFTYEDPIKQRQIFVLRPGQDLVHTWAYTAPLDMYDDYTQIMQDMLKSWEIV